MEGRMVDSAKMTNEEAIEHIARNLLDNFSKPLAIEALEKQIPKKPQKRMDSQFDISIGYCPICGNGINEEMNYCDCCGQKLDWSKEC